MKIKDALDIMGFKNEDDFNKYTELFFEVPILSGVRCERVSLFDVLGIGFGVLNSTNSIRTLKHIHGEKDANYPDVLIKRMKRL